MSFNKPKTLEVPLLDRDQQQSSSEKTDAEKTAAEMQQLRQRLELLQQQLVAAISAPQPQVMASSMAAASSAAASSASSSAASQSQFFHAAATTTTASDAKSIIKPITSAADLERLRKLADPENENNVEAQAHLGRMYLYGGWGVTKDVKEAEKWLRLASKQKASAAQLDAQGNCYEHGWGVTQNANQACACFEKAATEYKYAPAQFNFARYQEYGMKDEKEAFLLYNDSANQNYLPAIVIIGQCYAKGYGCLPDHQTALQYYQRAAEQEYPNAYTKLGMAYSDGIAGQNYSLSMTYLKKAAGREDEWGQYWLAYCYMNKSEPIPNVYAATEWYKRAAAQGNEEAKNALCCGRPNPCTIL